MSLLFNMLSRLVITFLSRSSESESVKVVQLYLTLCNLTDYTFHGILQTRILEWVAIPFSGGSSQPRDRTLVSCIAGGFFASQAIRELAILYLPHCVSTTLGFLL